MFSGQARGLNVQISPQEGSGWSSHVYQAKPTEENATAGLGKQAQLPSTLCSPRPLHHPCCSVSQQGTSLAYLHEKHSLPRINGVSAAA